MRGLKNVKTIPSNEIPEDNKLNQLCQKRGDIFILLKHLPIYMKLTMCS